MALLAADMLAQQLGFATADRPEQVTALEQRLAALESNSQGQRTIPPDVADRLTAAETKLGKLEQLDANVDGISKKQGQLDEGLNEIKDKIGTDSGETGSAARIAKLEEQLSLMSSAAESDPQSGRLPQLAAITGKLADLESTMANQLNALRRSVAAEFDTRLASAAEAGQTARSGTQRMDRELSTLKAESAEMSSGLTALKTDSDRAMASLKTTQEEIKRLKADLDTRLATFAKPEDVSTAVGPLSGKLAALQQDVQGVIKSEGDRRTTAERIVLSLELANLKRAIDRGNAYAPELEQARKVAGTNVDLAPLERFALEGVPTPTELRAQFKPIAFKIIDAEEQPADASIMDRLLAGASSVVRVRRTVAQPGRQEHRGDRRTHGNRLERGSSGRRAAGGERSSCPGARRGPRLPRQGAGARRCRSRARLRRNPAQGIARRRPGRRQRQSRRVETHGMLRLIAFLIAIALIAAGLAWLADRPGELAIQWQGYQIETSVFRAIVLLVALVAVALLIWSILRNIWYSPAAVGNVLSKRRQKLGIDALSSGMIALSAGDKSAAMRASHPGAQVAAQRAADAPSAGASRAAHR